MIRRMIRLGVCLAGVILVVLFVVRGIILPILHSGDEKVPQTTETLAQAETAGTEASQTTEAADAVEDTEPAAVSGGVITTTEAATQASRVPLKGAADAAKIGVVTPGWHESAEGRWYQNADGSYYAGGFQSIDGSAYSFDENGYIQTGWVSGEVKDYYFREDGTYDPEKTKPLLCLTFDDGPGQYTEKLLDCLEENGAKATFFMLGECIPSYPEAVKRMVEIGCELGNHSYDHLQLTTLSLDAAVQEYEKTDQELMQVVGQTSTVARAPYGDGNTSIYESVGKPFIMWSLDSLDWKYRDVQLDYNEVMNGDLTDGSIILMHDIHEASVESALLMIPELVAQGYKLVTVSEMAAAKNVTLQNTVYIDFWQSALEAGEVPGYNGVDSSLS